MCWGRQQSARTVWRRDNLGRHATCRGGPGAAETIALRHGSPSAMQISPSTIRTLTAGLCLTCFHDRVYHICRPVPDDGNLPTCCPFLCAGPPPCCTDHRMQRRRTKLRAQSKEEGRLRTSAASQRSNSPCFETQIARLFCRLGYRVHRRPATHDSGVDLVVVRTGFRAIVQCKCWRHPVGPAVVRDLYGTPLHTCADLGVLATTSTVSRSAQRFAQGKPLLLLDGALLRLLVPNLS